MKKLLIALIAAMFVSTPVMASEEDVVITSGGKKGTYFAVGGRLANMIRSNGFTPKLMTSKGSIENMQRLHKNEAQIGFVQADAYMWYMGKNPDAPVEIAGPLYKECIYVAANKNGKVQSEDDLEKKGVTISVGKRGSGSAVTWEYARDLEEGYKNASVQWKGGMSTLGKIASRVEGYDAFMWVTKPEKLDHKYLTTVLKNDNLILIDFNDYDMNDKLPNGQAVYEFRKIDVAKGMFNDTEVKTACVDAVMVVNSDMDEDLMDAVADIVLNYKASLLQ